MADIQSPATLATDGKDNLPVPVGMQDSLDAESNDHLVAEHNSGIPSVETHEPPYVEEDERTRIQRTMHIGKRMAQSALIATEVMPTNGVITYGVPLAVFAATGDIPVAAATAGLLTTGLEGAGALATADILSNSPNSTVVQRVKNLLNSRTVRSILASKDGRITPVAEGLIALYAGSPAAIIARESEPDAEHRTQDERRRYGLRTAATLGVICTAQMTLYTAGMQAVTESKPEIYVPVAATLVGATAVTTKMKNRAKAERAAEESRPRYDLSEEEMQLLEKDLVEDTEKAASTRKFGIFRKKQEGVYAVWLQPDSRYANIIRTREAEYFPEVKDVSPEVEDGTLFLALVDTRKDSKRLVHATTISGIDTNRQKPTNEMSTGLTTIDDLIKMGNFTAQEFKDYYKSQGIDTDHSISVDTNFRVGNKVTPVDGLKTADLAYLTMFSILKRQTPEGAKTAVFASINQDSIDSFKRIGLNCEPLMGRTDIVTPESFEGKEFHPIVIPFDENGIALFEGMNYEVQELNLGKTKKQK